MKPCFAAVTNVSRTLFSCPYQAILDQQSLGRKFPAQRAWPSKSRRRHTRCCFRSDKVSTPRSQKLVTSCWFCWDGQVVTLVSIVCKRRCDCESRMKKNGKPVLFSHAMQKLCMQCLQGCIPFFCPCSQIPSTHGAKNSLHDVPGCCHRAWKDKLLTLDWKTFLNIRASATKIQRTSFSLFRS